MEAMQDKIASKYLSTVFENFQFIIRLRSLEHYAIAWKKKIEAHHKRIILRVFVKF